MTTNDPLDQLLDARLREEMPYIDDDGFTLRVLQRLPAQRGSIRLQRSLVIFAAAILSAVVAYFASGQAMFVQDLIAQLSRLTPLQTLLLVVCCGAAMTATAVWAALSRTRDMVA